MFYSEVSIRDTHKSPKIVCRLADSFRGVSKLGKTRIIEDARRGVVRNTGFCGQNAAAGYIWNFKIMYFLKTISRIQCRDSR